MKLLDSRAKQVNKTGDSLFHDGYLISMKPYPKKLLEGLQKLLESPEVMFYSCIQTPKHCDGSETKWSMALGLCASGRFPLYEITNIINILKSTVYEISVKLFMERKTGEKANEEFYLDCIDYSKQPQGTGLMFWGAFRKGKIGPGVFFDLAKGEKVNSTTYRDQILLDPLKEFWEESFEDINMPIVMEDKAPVYKKSCIAVRQELGMVTLDWPPNSPFWSSVGCGAVCGGTQ